MKRTSRTTDSYLLSNGYVKDNKVTYDKNRSIDMPQLTSHSSKLISNVICF